jgi:type IV secretion system protein VirB4
VESTSRTPLYLNFHEKRSGSKNDFSPGTATITGPTGFGKTTLMLALDAQSQKYGGTRIFFDRGRGAEPYVRAMGGFYTQLKPGESTGFNPLSLPKTAENINFLTIWLGSLLLKNDGDQLTADEENHVVEVINRSYTLPFEDRQLSNIKSFFPTNFERLINLKAWIHSHNSDSPDGKYAYLFDNASDLEHQSDSLRLENQRMAGFDMFSLLRDAPQTVIFSVMVYLFHRVEALIDGKALMGIYLEEGWQLLNNSYWVKKIEAVINAGRKKNSFLVFTTQFPNTIARSALATVLIEGASTHIFLPNDKASRSDYVDCFKLTERQYELILGLTVQERKFLVMQRQEAALGTFNLAGLEDYIAILSGNDASASLLDEIRAEVGDDPALWLPRFQAQRLR